MKKTKKLLALVLAMVMAFSLMAVTAAAATEEHEHTHVCSAETVQPRIPAMECMICHVQMNTWVHEYNGQRVVDFLCPINSAHNIENVPW